MPTLITTSRKPDDFGRRLARILSHTIPDSKRVNRGNSSLTTLFNTAIEKGYDKFILVRTKFGHSAVLDFYTLDGETFVKDPKMLHMTDVIDHKIYGWRRIPGGAPISTSKKVREIHPELLDLLEDKFELIFDKVSSVSLLLDRDEEITYMTYVDTKTGKPFFYSKVKVVQ